MEQDRKFLEELTRRTSEAKEATEDNCEIDIVEKYATGFNSWLQCAPRPSRPIWETALFESSVLAGASFFLAIHGFYEEACAVLRTLLDGFLTRLYWDTQDKNGKLNRWKKNGKLTDDYWEWESGKTNLYPKPRDIWCVLQAVKHIGEYNDRYQLKNEINSFFLDLNKYVHSRPQSRHYPGASRSSLFNVKFKKKHFDEWFEYLKAVYRLVSVLSVLQYPELLKTKYGQNFAELESKVVARVRNVPGLQ